MGKRRGQGNYWSCTGRGAVMPTTSTPTRRERGGQDWSPVRDSRVLTELSSGNSEGGRKRVQTRKRRKKEEADWEKNHDPGDQTRFLLPRRDPLTRGGTQDEVRRGQGGPGRRKSGDCGPLVPFSFQGDLHCGIVVG